MQVALESKTNQMSTTTTTEGSTVNTMKSNMISCRLSVSAKPLSTSAVLLLLIPRWGAHILPPTLSSYIDHPDLIHWYPEACTICDDFRYQRKEMIFNHEQQLQKQKKETINMKENDLLFLKKKIIIERREFEDIYQRHVKSIHPVYPPPVKIVRDLLGCASSSTSNNPFSQPVLVPTKELILGKNIQNNKISNSNNQKKKKNSQKNSGVNSSETKEIEIDTMTELIEATSLLNVSVNTTNKEEIEVVEATKTMKRKKKKKKKKTAIQNQQQKQKGIMASVKCRNGASCRFGEKCRFLHDFDKV